jgi:hypothetical protein
MIGAEILEWGSVLKHGVDRARSEVVNAQAAFLRLRRAVRRHNGA